MRYAPRLRLPWPILFPALLALAPLTRGETANMTSLRQAWVADGWTDPEITGQIGSGKYSFKPPTRNAPRRRVLGATVGLYTVSVHEARVPASLYTYKLALENGRKLTMRVGDTVRIKGRRYKLLGERNGVLYLQDRRKKRRIRRFVQRKPKESPEPDAASSRRGR